MRRFNKAVLAGVVALAPIVGTVLEPAPASAQFAVVDVRAIAQMAQQLNQQVRMLQTQLQQYQNMVVNTASLPAQQWGQTMQSINQVNSLLRQAQSLSYQGQNIEQQIRSKYQGYGGYSTGNISSAALSSKYQQWSDDTNSSVSATMKALGLQNDQLGDEDALMQQLEAMGSSAQGRMQAAQVGNQLAAQGVRQTQKLRQLVMMQMQLQAGYLAQQQDRQALIDANGRAAYAHQQQATTGGQGYAYRRGN